MKSFVFVFVFCVVGWGWQSTGDESGAGAGRVEIQLMKEEQWSEIKAFLLYWLGKYAEMLVPPPNKFLLPVRLPFPPPPSQGWGAHALVCQVLEAVGRLVRKGLFVGPEVESVFITAGAILNNTKNLLVRTYPARIGLPRMGGGG